MAYATADDLLARKDARSVGQLVNDDDTQATTEQLASSEPVIQALQDGSDLVDAACLRGGRYQPSDLADMEGSGASLLKRLVCALAMTYLRRRRAYEEDEWPEYTEALEILERLGEGALVFGSVQAVIDAGNPVVDVLNATIQSSQGIVSSIASQRFLPSRNYPQ